MCELPKKETLTVEFKSDRGKGYSDEGLVDEIVGMTNTEGARSIWVSKMMGE